MSRNFSGINFRRDFSRRMTANEHDQSFDTVVNQLRNSTESAALNEGHSMLADVTGYGTPLNPNQYAAVGKWVEVKNTSALGLSPGGTRAVVETYRGGEGTAVQNAVLTTTGAMWMRLGSDGGGWAPWQAVMRQSDFDDLIPVGFQSMWPFTNPPPGGKWLIRNGATLLRANYPALVAKISWADPLPFGVGNGTTTFTLPDDRGNFERGVDAGRGVDPGRVFGSEQNGQALVPRDGWGVLQSGIHLPEPTTAGRLVTGSGRTENSEDLESLAHALNVSVNCVGDIRGRNRGLLPIIRVA